MLGVNNFLTDLIDDTIRSNLSCLTVQGGKKPSVVENGKQQVISDSIVDTEELFEDLKALNLMISASYMQNYTHQTPEGNVYKVFVTIDRGDQYATFYISRTIAP